MDIKSFIICNEFIFALIFCLISFYFVQKDNFVLVKPSKENMANVEYSHFGIIDEE